MQEDSVEHACQAFKGCLVSGTYVAVSCIHHMTILHVHHVRLEGPGLLCKMPENLMSHVWPWNLQVLELGVVRHFVKVLGDGHDSDQDLKFLRCSFIVSNGMFDTPRMSFS